MTPVVAPQPSPIISRLIKPLEILSAALLVIIIVLLFVGVVARYVFSLPIVWIDEVVSMSFLWLAMLGTAIAMHRNEHLRLSLFLEMMPKKIQGLVHALALVAIAAFLLALIHPAMIYAQEEWFVKSPALNIPNTYRVSALAFGILAMFFILVTYAVRTVSLRNLAAAVVVVSVLTGICWLNSGALIDMGHYNIALASGHSVT
jgi:TRAP-type C4-dicarboxylate transport system permease small subunit